MSTQVTRFSKTIGCFYPFSENYAALPNDIIDVPASDYGTAMAREPGETLDVINGRVVIIPKPAPTQDQIIAQYEVALDEHLDNVARQHRYDNRFMFALRSGYTGPYQADGKAFGTWMDACNAQAYGLLKDVVDGKKTMPTIEDFIAGLPPFVIP